MKEILYVLYCCIALRILNIFNPEKAKINAQKLKDLYIGE